MIMISSSSFSDFIDEYVLSQEYLFLSSTVKEHAAGLLGSFADFCGRRGFTLDAFSIVALEEVLMEHMARLNAPLAVRKEIPDVLRGFFDYLVQSGKFPPAGEWSGWVTALEEKFQSKFRDDGSVRGETFKKKYTDVNRNDPCPCGSGKKFKKCCMKLIS
jgi:hypothetical protein